MRPILSLALLVAATITLSISASGNEPRSEIDGGALGLSPAISTSQKVGGSDAATAVPIIAKIFRDSGNTTGLGNDALLPTCLSSGSDTAEDAWYTVTLSKTGKITAWTTCASVGPPSYDTRLGIFDETLDLIACNDDDPGCSLPNRQSRINNLSVGAGTYYIVVDGWSGMTGPYELNVEWSENGPACSGSNETNPSIISFLPFSDSGDNSSDCDDYLVTCELPATQGGPDHWYQLTVDTDVFLDVSTLCDPGDNDTRIAVLSSALESLYCSDDDPGCADGQSSIEDAVVPAGTYFIVVDSADFVGGTYTVQVDTTHAPPGSLEEYRPDIITRENDLYDHEIVTDIVPGRTHLRFANATANIGEGDLYLYGVLPANPDGTQDVRQRIFQEFGGFYDRDAGSFVYHPEHDHIHLEDWADYRIREVTPGNGVGAIVASGPKTSFCILDLVIHDSSLPGFSPVAQFEDCNSSIQGQSVGWADVYGKTLPGQNIDITDVPDGVYWLESIADPEDSILETNETNNVARIKIVIGTPTSIVADAYEPNDSHSQLDSRTVGGVNSPVFGPCGPVKSVTGLTIHAEGNDDYYRFYIPDTGGTDDALWIDFLHAQGDLDLQLLTTNGAVLDSSMTTSDSEVISLNGIPEGWYDARVFSPAGSLQPNYTISIDPPENGSPTIEVTNPPAGDTQVSHGYENYTITWVSDDPEGNETWVNVFANTSAILDGNEQLIPTSENTPGDQGLFVLNTAYLPLGTYYIYLEITDGGSSSGDWSDGTITLENLTGVEDLGPRYASKLLPNIPNPFNPATTLRLQLQREGYVHWGIYDLRGVRVHTVVNGMLSPGLHERIWNGRDDAGRTVSSGVYISAAEGEDFSATQKLLLLK